MRYGSCNSRSPALLAGGVVARSQRRLLVSPARLADAPPPLHLSAVSRAITLPPIATCADDHQPAAPRAVEHPVALLDGRAPATEGWTQRPPPAILSLIAVFIALAVARKPRPLRQRLGFVLSVETVFYRTDRWTVTRPSAALAIVDIHGMRLGKPHPPLTLGGWGEPYPGRVARGERTTSSADAPEEPEPPLRPKPPENRAFQPPPTVQACRNNMRAVLQRIEAGEMLP